MGAARYRYPYITVKLINNRPIQVVRFSPATEIRVIYDIDYSDPNRIQVELTRETNQGEQLRFAYGIYELDGNQNVTHVQRFRINTDNFEEFILYEDRYFTYDEFTNPTQGLLLPFFAVTRPPDVKFFSANNPLTITENDQIARYSYEYGEDNNTLSQIPPGEEQVRFTYFNCQ